MEVHGNEYHDPDFSSVAHDHAGVYEPADAGIQTHITGTGSPHTAAGVGADPAGTAAAAVSAHNDLTTGVHGVGAGTVAKVADIAVDLNLSAAAQDAISKRHAEAHTLASHSSKAHSELTGVGATDHHSNANDPTSDQKAALAGTSGTPSATNKYVTNDDARNSDARTPVSHDNTYHSSAFALETRKLDDFGTPDDNTDLNASTSAHGLAVKATAPAAGVRNVLAIDNAETAYKNTALVDDTNPAALGTASPGTQLVAARRDHVHTLPKLDDAAAPDDNTDLNVSTSAHGLAPKAPNNTYQFLRADVSYARPRANAYATTSSSTPTPDADTYDTYCLTALAVAAEFAAPTGTPVNGQKLVLRIKDDGTGRALTWNAIYRSCGQTLPTTTTASKTMYVGLIYNSADAKWDCVAVSTEA